MNHWTQLSVDLANQQNYLDSLFAVYPTIPDGPRPISPAIWRQIEVAFNANDDVTLLRLLLDLDLFPIKDSYVAYLKRDETAIVRNPATTARLCTRLRALGLDEMFERCSEPKETNRQIGPMFKSWISRGSLVVPFQRPTQFMSHTGNAVLDASDAEMMGFASQHFNYNRNKGLDFIGRFNNQYVIGEAKFLTDFGGHQNAQFADGMSTVRTPNVNAIIVGIFDGVCYIPGRNKLFVEIELNEEHNIMSALVLRQFLDHS